MRSLLTASALVLALSVEVAPTDTKAPASIVAPGATYEPACGSDLDCACLARMLCAWAGFEPTDPACQPRDLPEHALDLAAAGECERQGWPDGEGWR
jgi:hypothetical protein